MKSRVLSRYFAINISFVLFAAVLSCLQVLAAQATPCAPHPNVKSLSWTQATPEAAWLARTGHATVVFHDRLWILGGSQDSNYGLNDIWSSMDGVNWTLEVIEAGWSRRYGHEAIVFQDKIWVLGGKSASGYMNDVWVSDNGLEWTNVLEAGIWPARAYFGCSVFDGKIFLLGGYYPALNDVWSSDDGTTWIQILDHASWIEREGPVSIVFREKLWLLGGASFPQYSSVIALNDVWSSEKGNIWTQVAADSEWHGRAGHRVVSFDNQLVLFGGAYIEGSGPGSHLVGLNDVWLSSDGISWLRSSDAPWPSRSSHTAVALNNRLWVLGGTGYDPYVRLNDVWYAEIDHSTAFSAAPLSGPAPLTVQFTDESTASGITAWAWDFGDGETSTDQHPSHVYENRGLYTVSLTVTSDSGAGNETKEGYITVQGTSHEFHTADQNQDHAIDLSELLRMIQFMNSDGFHCEGGTEDGYAAGPGDTACALHDADYAPPDNAISLSELLRIVQFFNAAGYESCETGEDGFCVIME